MALKVVQFFIGYLDRFPLDSDIFMTKSPDYQINVRSGKFIEYR